MHAKLFQGKVYWAFQLQKNSMGCWLDRGVNREGDMWYSQYNKMLIVEFR